MTKSTMAVRYHFSRLLNGHLGMDITLALHTYQVTALRIIVWQMLSITLLYMSGPLILS